MSTALVLGDTASLTVRSAVRAARSLVGTGKVDLLLIGRDADAAGEKATRWKGVSRLLVGKTNTPVTAECATRVTRAQMDKSSYNFVVAAADSFGKNLIPRLAGTLGLAALSDVTNIIDAKQGVFVRPMYAGNALATVRNNESVKVLTVRPTAFEPVGVCTSNGEEKTPIASIDTAPFTNTGAQWVGEQSFDSTRPDLSSASVVIAGGRGLKNAENFKLLGEIADVLNGAVGATRAAVDLGWVPNDMQIGQTGKVVAPKLYFAIGLSGAIQHLAGMKDSKIIVAINKDPDAPIFQIADYGLIGDLFEVLPQLVDKIKVLSKEHS